MKDSRCKLDMCNNGMRTKAKGLNRQNPVVTKQKDKNRTQMSVDELWVPT